MPGRFSHFGQISLTTGRLSLKYVRGKLDPDQWLRKSDMSRPLSIVLSSVCCLVSSVDFLHRHDIKHLSKVSNYFSRKFKNFLFQAQIIIFEEKSHKMITSVNSRTLKNSRYIWIAYRRWLLFIEISQNYIKSNCFKIRKFTQFRFKLTLTYPRSRANKT